MAQKLTGRKEEIRQMTLALQSGKPELVAVIGRRRVGKTFLIRHVFGDITRFEMTGIQNSNTKEQLHNFFLMVRSHFPDTMVEQPPESWLDAFQLLSSHLDGAADTGGKMVVVFDELPWLATKRSGFLRGFSYFWNSWASRKDIVVVICGSATSWMIHHVINDRGGLHNRVTRFLHLEPFTLQETEEFLLSKNIMLDRYHILQLYMAMGGIPMYLEFVEAGKSAVQNIQQICFSPHGFLRHEYDRLFPALFEHYEKHLEIIRALASKRTGLTREEILTVISIKNGGTLSKYLQELIHSGFVSIYGPFGKKKKDALYRLTDPYTMFYLTFIEPLGAGSHQIFTNISELPQWKSWSGFTFETICLKHIGAIRHALGISGISSRIASFYARPTDEMSGTQIDLVIDRHDQAINICEMKFYREPYVVNKAFVENMQRKKAVFRHHTGTRKHLFTTLITPFGAVENTYCIQHVDQVITVEELFR